jgi:hypothetical protein
MSSSAQHLSHQADLPLCYFFRGVINACVGRLDILANFLMIFLRWHKLLLVIILRICKPCVHLTLEFLANTPQSVLTDSNQLFVFVHAAENPLFISI